MAVQTLYQKPVTIKFTPDMMNFVASIATVRPPEPCPDHLDETGKSDCVRALADSWMNSEGWAETSAAIDVPTLFPNTPRKLTNLHVEFTWESWGSYLLSKLGASIAVRGDNINIFGWQDLPLKLGEWTKQDYPLDIDLAAISKLDISVWESLIYYQTLAWGAVHVRNIILSGWYYTETPSYGDLTVYVRNLKAQPISNAYVAILSGTAVVDDGYTDGGGITFKNMPTGSYTIKIAASGYKELIDYVNILEGTNLYEATLEETPPEFVLPWWWWIPIATIGGLAFMAVLIPALKRRPAPPPVYVVK